MAQLAMQHLNDNILCAIDVETTGLDPVIHEIVEIAIVPLDSEIRPRTDIMPFNVYIKPQSPETIDQEAFRVNQMSLEFLSSNGLHPDDALNALMIWLDNLKLRETHWGAKKQIVPLGQNYSFDQEFIRRWIGRDTYSYWFHRDYRDTKITAMFINDRLSRLGENVVFNKSSLEWLGTTLGIPAIGRSHSALVDAVRTAAIYRELTTKFNLQIKAL